MIHVIVSYGSGDRPAAIISDQLIADEASAIIRAKQELARYTYIVTARSLSVPHDPEEKMPGELTEDLSYQPLDIYGAHLITGRTMTLTHTSCTDEISLEQYREMVL